MNVFNLLIQLDSYFHVRFTVKSVTSVLYSKKKKKSRYLHKILCEKDKDSPDTV